MRAFLALSCLSALVLAEDKPSLTRSTLHGVKRDHKAGELIFEDNFDTLDMETWQHEITMAGGGNWEFQVYWNNRTNSYTRDGNLYLRPTLTEEKLGEDGVRYGALELWGGQKGDYCTQNAWYGCARFGDGTNIINPVASARLRTAGAFSFTYGKVEVRAKNPAGDWIWPAIWMLPENVEYGGWPNSGEIDIMESRGNLDLEEGGVQVGAEQVGQTLHFGVDYTMNGWPHAHFDKNSPSGQGFNQDFHTYELEWTPEYMKFSIDGAETGTVDVPAGGFWELGNFDSDFPGVDNPWENTGGANAPFDRPFHIILNVAVGGTAYFSDNAVNGGAAKPWLNTSPNAALDFYNAKGDWAPTWVGEDSALTVDYVRVYAL